uniref:Uncharacterized protein n=1 Tax=uncultured Methanosarcinales archaeon TaxID=183757 RepID=A0A7H1KNF5_9EURY|nr:hypothetical protein EKMJPAOO_00019 [uncultured Methanosarcinales archaeon]
MPEEERISEIISTIQKIKESKQPVTTYFEQNPVPFYVKLTERIKDYIVSTVREDRSISSPQLQNKILNQFDVKISESSLNNFRTSVSLTRLPRPKEERYKDQKSGGGAILTSLAFATRIIELFTRTILDQVDDVRQSSLFKQNKNIGKDHPDTRLHGTFTGEYNQLKHVRENRFRSIDDKIKNKDFSAMNIFEMSEKTISRHNLDLLCLPLVTSNGKTSRVNRVK